MKHVYTEERNRRCPVLKRIDGGNNHAVEFVFQVGVVSVLKILIPYTCHTGGRNAVEIISEACGDIVSPQIAMQGFFGIITSGITPDRKSVV
jgi:hypothetical protein